MQLTANVNEASNLSLDNIREIQEETGRIDNAMMKSFGEMDLLSGLRYQKFLSQ